MYINDKKFTLSHQIKKFLIILTFYQHNLSIYIVDEHF